jgi:hypothetical protein
VIDDAVTEYQSNLCFCLIRATFDEAQRAETDVGP